MCVCFVFAVTHSQVYTCMMAISGHEPSCPLDPNVNIQWGAADTCRYPT